jgi:hypothetical protein
LNPDRSCERVFFDERIWPHQFQQFLFFHQTPCPSDKQHKDSQGLWFQRDVLSCTAKAKVRLIQLEFNEPVARYGSAHSLTKISQKHHPKNNDLQAAIFAFSIALDASYGTVQTRERVDTV